MGKSQCHMSVRLLLQARRAHWARFSKLTFICAVMRALVTACVLNLYVFQKVKVFLIIKSVLGMPYQIKSLFKLKLMQFSSYRVDLNRTSTVCTVELFQRAQAVCYLYILLSTVVDFTAPLKTNTLHNPPVFCGLCNAVT